jgi:cobalamin-dependent methionine synthase I
MRAMQLVRDYGYPARPLEEVMAHAWRVLHAAIHGVAIKKKEAVSPVKPRTPRSTKAKP